MDIDLLVSESESSFALVIHHKWLNGPDALSESIANYDRLVEGVTQETNSREYCQALQNKPSELRVSSPVKKVLQSLL